jgi:hypothetical protein
MNTQSVVISLVLLVAVDAAGFSVITDNQASNTPVNTPASTPSLPLPPARPPQTNQFNQNQMQSLVPPAPQLTPEKIAQIKQKLMTIQKMSPEERTKALQELQNKMSKQPIITTLPQPSAGTNPSTSP